MGYCILVDTYRWSKYFRDFIHKLGHECIYIQTSKEPLPRFKKGSTYNPGDYSATFIYDGNFENLISSLQPYKPILAAIPGVESDGVKLADQLNHHLKLPGNDINKVMMRTDKYFMGEILIRENMTTMKQFKSSDLTLTMNWINQNLQYPVVLKPTASAGTDGVYICDTENEVRHHFGEILSTKENLLGRENNEVLVQSFLDGKEYIVNTVSCNGEHVVTDVWECRKRVSNNRPLYDTELLLSPEDPSWNIVVPYVKKVLDVMGIKFGSTHSEVMLTKNGPELIELGARMGGNVMPAIHSECFGINQADLCIYAYIQPDLFRKIALQPYKIQKKLLHVLISTESEGIITAMPLVDQVKQLSSFRHISMSVGVGDELVPTFDLLSKPGDIWMAHSSGEVLNKEYKTLICEIVPNGFKVKPKNPLELDHFRMFGHSSKGIDSNLVANDLYQINQPKSKL